MLRKIVRSGFFLPLPEWRIGDVPLAWFTHLLPLGDTLCFPLFLIEVKTLHHPSCLLCCKNTLVNVPGKEWSAPCIFLIPMKNTQGHWWPIVDWLPWYLSKLRAWRKLSAEEKDPCSVRNDDWHISHTKLSKYWLYKWITGEKPLGLAFRVEWWDYTWLPTPY